MYVCVCVCRLSVGASTPDDFRVYCHVGGTSGVSAVTHWAASNATHGFGCERFERAVGTRVFCWFFIASGLFVFFLISEIQ